MPYTQVSNLDYGDIKTVLKEYLRAQSDFTDYDFEGSTWSVLLDTLAYNTYYTAFNTNLVVNELFLDSASLRDNVVAIAKQLGYTPKSITAPKAFVSFNNTFTGTAPKVAYFRAGSAFTTIFDNTLYQYTLVDDYSTPVVNGVATFTDIPIFEGSYLKQSYTINTALKNQRFVLNNTNIDTSSIRVKVYVSQSSSAYELYERAENILDLNSTSRAYYINEIEDENYEIFFGDGVIGNALENGNFIEVSYLVTNGPATNGAKTFVFNGLVNDVDENVYPANITITNVEAATGGEDIETIDKIKFNAPKFFGTQNRAVTADDYASIVRNIYPSVSDIIVYGGEEAEPPDYGTVKLVIKPENTAFISGLVKKQILDELKSYNVASVRPEILDPSILYIELNTSVYFDRIKTAESRAQITNKVIQAIEDYTKESNTEKFNGKFRYSKYVAVTDAVDRSINSTTMEVTLRKDFFPQINSTFSYEICFKNEFRKPCDDIIVQSTGFVVTEYPSNTVFLKDQEGKMVLYTIDTASSSEVILNDNVGSVDYVKGEVMLDNLTIIKGSLGDNTIQLRAQPKNDDVNAVRELYLDVDITNSQFNAYPE
jgi:hypothetical protein